MDRVEQKQQSREGKHGWEFPLYDCLKTNPELSQKAYV